VALRVRGKIANQARPLNDQVGTIQRDVRPAAIGKQFKFANFVDYGGFADLAQQRVHVAGDNECARRWIQLVGALQQFHVASRARQ